MNTETETITLTNLNRFQGSEESFYNRMFPNINYTQGVQWIGANGASWLQIAILSHLAYNKKVKNEEFVTASLLVKDDETAVLTFDDGNDNVLATQEFEYADFPIHNVTIKFFYTNGILMLASEY